MKRSEKLGIMLAVLAALCLLTFGLRHYETKKEQIRETDAVILAIAPDTVTSVSWDDGDIALAFHKEENWIYDGDDAFPVNGDTLEDSLAVFRALGAAFVIEEPENLSLYGLDSPSCTISLEADGTAYEILLGGYSVLDEQRYVSIGDGNVYLVKEDPLDAFQKKLSDYVKHDAIPIFYKTTEITFSGTENYTVCTPEDSTLSYCAEDTYFVERGGQWLPLETGNVTTYLSALQSVALTDYVSYNATGEELEAYGLAEPELTATIAYETENGDQREFTFHIGRNQEELKQAEEDDSVTVSAYIRIGDSQLLYPLTASKYKTLAAAGYDDLRHDEVMTADFEDIHTIEISLDGTLYAITSQKEENQDRVFYYNDEELDLSGFRVAAKSMRSAEYTDEAPTGREEISVTYYLDNENFPEIRVTLYRYDGTNCLAQVNGETVCLVSRTAAVDLIEAVNAIVLG